MLKRVSAGVPLHTIAQEMLDYLPFTTNREEDSFARTLKALYHSNVLAPTCFWRYLDASGEIILSGEVRFKQGYWTINNQRDPVPLDHWRDALRKETTDNSVGGFSLTLSADSRGDWFSPADLEEQLKVQIDRKISVVCQVSSATSSAHRMSEFKAQMQRLVNLECLRDRNVLLSKTRSDVLRLVENAAPLLMGDLALLLKVPTGQLRKTSKSMDESRKENRLLAVIGMMAHAHSKSCLAIPEALGLWLRNKGVPVDVRVGLNRFGFSCSPDHVQDILEEEWGRGGIELKKGRCNEGRCPLVWTCSS